MMMQIGRSQGMVLMDDYLNELVKQGLITEEDARSRYQGKGEQKAGAK